MKKESNKERLIGLLELLCTDLSEEQIEKTIFYARDQYYASQGMRYNNVSPVHEDKPPHMARKTLSR